MPSTKKILNQLRSLQQLGVQVQEDATSLIDELTKGEDVKASPRIKRRSAIVLKAVNKRNQNLKRAI